MTLDKHLKVVVVGGVAGGASAAARIKRLDEKAEVVVLEKGEHVSFSNCCLPYHLSGTVEKSESLILMTPQAFKVKHDIDVRVKSCVTAIDRQKKTVTVDGPDGVYEESYDKLVLSPGASPIVPGGLKGADKAHVFTVRNVTDIRAIKAKIDDPAVEKIAVVGGGFIGIEVAENLQMAGKTVTIIEMAPQILAPFDEDMVQILHKELDDNGIRLMVGTELLSIGDKTVTVRRDGRESRLKADAVILAIGVRPETALAREAGLEIGETGAIRVDAQYRTNDPDIYAVGDAVEVYMAQTRTVGRLPLAGPAQMEARAAADHICGIADRNEGFISAMCLRVFRQNAAAAGLNEMQCRRAGLNYDSVLLFPTDKVGIMPGSHYMALKILFEKPTGLVLGAQAVGPGDVVGRINTAAAVIRLKGTLYDLKDLNLCYSPVYNTAKDPVNMAALVGINILENRVRQVHVRDVRGLVEQGAFIVDVREKKEYAAGRLKGSVNIPLTELRARAGEIPKDVPVYLHCRSSQRSYYAIRCLQGLGWDNLYNISGSYLGISLYEYFRDKTEGREPILDNYNFR